MTIYIYGASLIAQSVKNPPAMQETWVQSLGREDPLEKEMATHSSILAWKIAWTEEPGRLQSMRSQESDTTEQLNHHHIHIYIYIYIYIYIERERERERERSGLQRIN